MARLSSDPENLNNEQLAAECISKSRYTKVSGLEKVSLATPNTVQIRQFTSLREDNNVISDSQNKRKFP